MDGKVTEEAEQTLNWEELITLFQVKSNFWTIPCGPRQGQWEQMDKAYAWQIRVECIGCVVYGGL